MVHYVFVSSASCKMDRWPGISGHANFLCNPTHVIRAIFIFLPSFDKTKCIHCSKMLKYKWAKKKNTEHENSSGNKTKQTNKRVILWGL